MDAAMDAAMLRRPARVPTPTFLLLLLLSLLSSLPAYARTKLQFDVTDGATSVLSRVTGAAVSAVKTCPGASVALRVTGTSTAVTVYTDSAGSNPSTTATANLAGRVAIWVDDGVYDIVMSGGGCSSHTWSEVSVSGGEIAMSVLGFGAKCDGTTNDTAAFQRAFDFSGPHTVTMPGNNRTCLITDEARITQNGVNLMGAGMRASNLLFVPTANQKAAVRVGKLDGSGLFHSRISDLRIYSTDTTYTKYAIRFDRVSRLKVENIEIGPAGQFLGGSPIAPFTGGGSSAGVYSRGWEYATFRNMTVYTDIPFHIGLNAGDPNIDMDHYHFEDISSAATGSNPHYYVESCVNITTSTWDGTHSWVGGDYGVYWNDDCNEGQSNDMNFTTVRMEQVNSTNGYLFYINKTTTALYDLRVNAYNGVTQGFYLRNVRHIFLNSYRHPSTYKVLDIDSTVDRVLGVNVETGQNSTISAPGFKKVWGMGFPGSLAPLSFEFLLEQNSNLTAGIGYQVMEVNQNCLPPTTVADDATIQIPSRSGSIVQGRIAVTYKGATFQGSFTTYIDSGRAYIESTTDTSKATTETGLGNVDGRITIDWQSAASILIRNRLGESVTVQYCQMLN